LSLIGVRYQDFGIFEKSGNSTWTLQNESHETTDWLIREGELLVGDADNTDTTINGNVFLNEDARLRGFGQINGNVSNYFGGMVMPGGNDTIGTLTINGNYIQKGDDDFVGTLGIVVTPEAASQLAVTGTAALGGTLNLYYAPGVYTAKSYTILTANSITGEFSTIGGKKPEGFTLAESVTYGDKNVDLLLGDDVVVTPTDNTTFSSLGNITMAGGQTATGTIFDQLGGLHGSGAGGGSAMLRKPIQVASNGSLDGLLSGSGQPAHRFWMQSTGRLSSIDSNGAVAGYKTKSGGVMIGVDKPFGENFIAGIAAGYDQSYLDESNGNSGHVKTPRLALYGSYTIDRIALDGLLGYGHAFIDSRRPIIATGDTATASHGGDEVSAAVQASIEFTVADVIVTPNAGLAYVRVAEESFNESGAPGFNLNVDSRTSNSLRPSVGLSAEKSFKTTSGTKLTPRVEIGYSHELMNDAPSSTVSVGGGTFSINGLQPSRNRLTAGTSLNVNVSDDLSLHAGYKAVLPTGNVFAQSFDIGFVLKF
ncbi:MAG: autotransporter outer membrane beta-barrel domain-containing protein, partial [Parvibaculum sp.]|nr:autotransporter outer membrane beta-barrel domain-containing protein [Parvibaculum sp.]